MKSAAAIVRSLAMAVAIGTALLSAPAYADQPPTIPRIGALVPPPANSAVEVSLRDALRELGYIEGKNILIDWQRFAGTVEETRPYVAHLLRSKVDLIAIYGTPASRAALDATKTVPVVFVSGDPIGTGLAASLARPGGNATGVSTLSPELIAKRLEFLRLVAPRARRIVYLMNSSNPNSAPIFEGAQRAAKTLGVQLVKLDARNAAEVRAALHAIRPSAAEAVLVTGDNLFVVHKADIARAVRRARLPAMFPWREDHDAGVLMSYGPSIKEMMRHMAVYVEKILRGAQPADLPIEQLSKYDLIINLREAHALGINVPQALFLLADEVIQ